MEGAISPTGQLIAAKETYSYDAGYSRDNVFIYDLNGSLKFSFRDPTTAQNGLAFLDDYHVIIAGWNETLREIIRKYRIGEKGSFSVIHEEDRDISRIRLKCVSSHQNLLFYDNNSGLVCRNINWGQKVFEICGGIYDAQFSPNDQYLGLNADLKSRVVSTQSGETLWESNEHAPRQLFLCFSPDNTNFVVSLHNRLEFWNTGKWKKIGQTKKDDTYTVHGIYAGAYSPDNKLLATVGGGVHHDETISLWDTSNFEEPVLKIPSPHGTRIQNLKFTFDSKELITIGEKDIIVWQIRQEQTTAGEKDIAVWQIQQEQTTNIEIHVDGDVNAPFVVGNENTIGSQ